MKKSFVFSLTILICLAMAMAAHAVTWTVANQSTISWNAVTKTSQGNDFQEGDTVKYKVYVVDESAVKSSAVELGETDLLEYVITFETEGRWLAGVKSIRTPAASPTDIQESGITWSDVTDVVAVPVPFGFIFFEAPANPGGVGPK